MPGRERREAKGIACFEDLARESFRELRRGPVPHFFSPQPARANRSRSCRARPSQDRPARMESDQIGPDRIRSGRANPWKQQKRAGTPQPRWPTFPLIIPTRHLHETLQVNTPREKDRFLVHCTVTGVFAPGSITARCGQLRGTVVRAGGGKSLTSPDGRAKRRRRQRAVRSGARSRQLPLRPRRAAWHRKGIRTGGGGSSRDPLLPGRQQLPAKTRGFRGEMGACLDAVDGCFLGTAAFAAVGGGWGLAGYARAGNPSL